MLDQGNRLLVMEILHRLELDDAVSIEELIYLHGKASEHPEVEEWLENLFAENTSIVSELNPSIKDFYAA